MKSIEILPAQAGRTILEVGAGIGNHTSFFLDRGCESSEAREENLEMIRARFPNVEVRRLDLDSPDKQFTATFDIVYCYGLLYHLENSQLVEHIPQLQRRHK